MTTSTYIRIGVGFLVAVAGVALLWFFFLRPTPAEQPAEPSDFTANNASQSVDVTPVTPANNTSAPNAVQTAQQKIFKVVDGPIVGATVVQMLRPTTTVARYVQQNNGHVFDLTLDSSGAVPKAISNTTIPGVARALWANQGNTALLQYLDNNITKTVSLGFPPQGTTTSPVVIKFLPDGIHDIAISPNGTRVVYLLRTASGVDGYTAASDGSGGTKVFSLPLSEILISWPSQNTILAYTKSASGTPGIAFSINVSTGAVVPLLYATGLTVAADPTYSYILYQTTSGSGPSTYIRDTTNGTHLSLSFNPYPERCVWGSAATSTLYCAAPLTAPGTYLDFWHRGAASGAEIILGFTLPSGRSSILAVPGGESGGVGSTIDTLSLSPDERYLLFVRRGDRSLWGVRLQ